MKRIIIFFLLLFSYSNTQTSTQILITPEYQSGIFDRNIITKIFTKKITHWSDGQVITVYIKPINSIEHKDFVQTWLNMSNSKYKQELEDQVYSGKAFNVTEVENDSEMMFKISSTNGSIGYVNYGLLVNTKTVKVVVK